MNDSFFRVENLSFFYGNAQVLRDISFSLPKGGVLCILGKSGTGKTTLLNLIAGFISPSQGNVFIDNRSITNMPIHKRKELGYVFQSGQGLFPHLSVYQNVAFPFSHGNRSLSAYRRPWKEAVIDILDEMDLGERKNSMLWELSGGMLQRVALARALVYEPDILLLDEPLGSLDNSLKNELLDLLQTLQKRLSKTLLYVTHDEREALALGTHLLILGEGRVLQEGDTETVTNYPATSSVAKLIGGWNILDYSSKLNEAKGDDENDLLRFANQSLGAHGSKVSILGFPIAKTRVRTNEDCFSAIDSDSFQLRVTIRNNQTWHGIKHVTALSQSNKPVKFTIQEKISFHEGQQLTLTIRKEDLHGFQA